MSATGRPGTHGISIVAPCEGAAMSLHAPGESDAANDPRMVRIIDVLEQDPFVHRRWKDHDPSFGYNTFKSYVDENVTKALDQLIGERVGMTYMDDVEERWIQNDEGMHVLAAAVYELMKAENFLDGRENATEFLERMVLEKRLVPGKIEALVPQRVRTAGVTP